MDSLGCLWLTLEYCGRKTKELVIICPEHDGILLSLSACVNLGMVHENYPNPLPVNISSLKEQRTGETLDLETERAKLLEEFADVFEQSSDNLPVMAGQPVIIELKEDAVPYAVNGARPIPYAQWEEVKRMLDEMEVNDVVAKVTVPSDWVHPLVVVSKPNGKLRICVDLTKLNIHVKRPTHPLRTTRDAIGDVSSRSRLFSTFYAVNGYWQVSLDKASQHLTTFMTPWGRYKFLRATMGLWYQPATSIVEERMQL